MTALSASQAIMPAIDRTRKFLFDRFRWLTFLKLSLVAALTEGVSIRLRYTVGHAAHAAPAASASTPADFFSHWLWLIGLLFVLGLPIAVFALYLVTRLRFAFFYCLTRNSSEIRPGWALYAQQSMRLFEVSLAIWAVFALLAGSVLYPLFNHYLALRAQSGPNGFNDFAAALSFVFSSFFTFLFLYAIIWFADTILHDFLVPHMALENLSVVQAWEQFLSRATSEPSVFTTYLGERFILPIIGFMALSIVAAILGAILSALVAVPLASMEAVVRAGSLGGAILAALVLLPLAILAVAVAIFVSICLGGPLATWIRNFALIFYGGRYQALGDLLNPAETKPFQPPPPPVEAGPTPPPAEADEPAPPAAI
ncbi:MAG TPA: hypothetical protein VND90_04315 [Terracidiphilus sp.]|nr:hypothetical protein [Terracidiphilus sp.]